MRASVGSLSCGDVARVRGQRGLERVLGLRPAPGRHQDVGVNRAARPEQRSGRVRAGELVDQLAPLVGPLPLAGGGARVDQVAVGLGQGVDVAHTAGRRRGHRLLEQLHALLAVAGIHLRAAEQAEREDLEIVGAVRARDVHRPARMGDLLLRVAAVTGPLDRHPPVPGAAADAVERALGAGQPAAGRRSAARHEVLVRHPDGHPRRVVAAAGADVVLERALAHGDAARDIAQEPQRLSEAVAGVRRLAGLEHGLEGDASGLPVRSLHRLHALDQGFAGGQGLHEGRVSRPGRLCSSAGITPS